MIYLICTVLFWVGAAGIGVQALLGGFHGGHAGHNSGVAHTGHNGAGHTQSAHGGHGPSRGASMLLTIASPLTLFSFCLGAGAAGLLVRHYHFAGGIVALCALLGGMVFFGAVVRPLFSILLKFGSTPSEALDGALAHEAEAISAFDSAGKGLVQLSVDGQLVRILATLEADEHVKPSDISPGDRLTVTSVDGHTNSCRVARL